VPVYQHALVRLLAPHEVDLALSGPGGSIGAAYGSPQAILAEGWIAGAVMDGELVARAHTSCHSATYADVAIATREQWQGQGLATAAASLVCQHGIAPAIVLRRPPASVGTRQDSVDHLNGHHHGCCRRLPF
jgi:hypothetical protein